MKSKLILCVLMVVVAIVGCDADAGEQLEDDAGAAAAADCGQLVHGDAGAIAPDACVHVQPPMGPGPFTGCTCGDVLQVSPVNPDLVECVTP